MNDTRLTVEQVKNACESHDYILFRFTDNDLVGVNSKIAMVGYRQKDRYPNMLLPIIGYIPCDLNTYITHKIPYKS